MSLWLLIYFVWKALLNLVSACFGGFICMQASTRITHQSDFLTSQYVNPSGVCIISEPRLTAGTFADLLTCKVGWVVRSNFHSSSTEYSWTWRNSRQLLISNIKPFIPSHPFPVSLRQKLVQKRRLFSRSLTVGGCRLLYIWGTLGRATHANCMKITCRTALVSQCKCSFCIWFFYPPPCPQWKKKMRK